MLILLEKKEEHKSPLKNKKMQLFLSRIRLPPNNWKLPKNFFKNICFTGIPGIQTSTKNTRENCIFFYKEGFIDIGYEVTVTQI